MRKLIDSIEFYLSDPMDPSNSIRGKLSIDNGSLKITIDGYGTGGMPVGEGWPVELEFNDGQLNLIVWPDINEFEVPHIISLDHAKESRRKS